MTTLYLRFSDSMFLSKCLWICYMRANIQVGTQCCLHAGTWAWPGLVRLNYSVCMPHSDRSNDCSAIKLSPDTSAVSDT